MSGNANLVDATPTFMRELSNNNTKDWWQDHKAQFEADLKAPALVLLDQIGADLEGIFKSRFKTKLYRPHRDVRFFKDKTPYHTHLHMQWTPSDQDLGCGWFFGIGLDYARAGWGVVPVFTHTIDPVARFCGVRRRSTVIGRHGVFPNR